MASTQDLTSAENRTAVTGEQRSGQLAASATAQSSSADFSTQQNLQSTMDIDSHATGSTEQLPRLEDIPDLEELEGLRVQVQQAMRADDDEEMSSDFEAEMQSLTAAIHKCAEDIDVASLARHRARDQLVKLLASSMKHLSTEKNGLRPSETSKAINEMRAQVATHATAINTIQVVLETAAKVQSELEKRTREIAQRATDAQAIAFRAENRSIAVEERLNQFLRKHGGLDDGQNN